MRQGSKFILLHIEFHFYSTIPWKWCFSLLQPSQLMALHYSVVQAPIHSWLFFVPFQDLVESTFKIDVESDCFLPPPMLLPLSMWESLHILSKTLSHQHFLYPFSALFLLLNMPHWIYVFPYLSFFFFAFLTQISSRRAEVVFTSLLYPQNKKWFLAYSKCSINRCQTK